MSNWTDKTNQEINAAVAKLKWQICEVIDTNAIGSDAVAVIYEGEIIRYAFDPCNNAADAWPIIFGNNISMAPSRELHTQNLDGEWGAWIDDYFELDKNPLRAAMCVYLEMNGVEV